MTEKKTPTTRDEVSMVVEAAFADNWWPFVSANKSVRIRARNAIDAIMRERLSDDDLAGAQRAMAVRKSVDEAVNVKVRPEVDWNRTIADRIELFRTVADQLETGAFRPEGAPDGFRFDRDALPDDYKPEVDMEVVRTMATRRVGKASPTFDVGAAIRDAFADKSDGHFMSVAEIGRHWSANGGPDNNNGRIRARLFAPAGCTVTGIVPVESTTDRPSGAIKSGDWS